MPKTILIADDEVNVRITLGDILKEKGYNVIEASGPQEAIDKIHNEKPDLVLLDTKMPSDSEGDEVCRQIKKKEGLDVKIIIYTGYVDFVDAGKAKEVGADEYVVKTENFSYLLKAIESLI